MEYDSRKHVPIRKGSRRYIVSKTEYSKLNSTPITFVILCDSDYFILAEEQIKTIFIIEPQSEIILFDGGLTTEQKNHLKEKYHNILFEHFDIELLMKQKSLRRNEAMFYYKIHAMDKALKIAKYSIIAYSDAANVFLKPLNELKNYVEAHGLYAGMTEVFGYERIQRYTAFRSFAEKQGIDIYKPQFVLQEGGFWVVDVRKPWVKSFLNDYKQSTQTHFGMYQIFPHDMIPMSLLIQKYSSKHSFPLQELPNIRFNAILEKKTVFEKNMLVYDYTIEKIPFFGYAVHNCSNHPDAPARRRCTVPKDEIETYINLK